ncbi:putative acyl-CoA dehydrogenase [Rubripirellula tenax]|uniref:Putative acyl-CoA dehydrogenase n=1 Tax=Rubripirellula tenax TaxID=2528015 RepID=A0A5C6EEU9_9BACT|nr:acyl-CoA dehydrogenase family protein [Rubripirellula tenax]TWU46086.1 putative acyl-CoA dehydrogenase [Rubripirellula tenax]
MPDDEFLIVQSPTGPAITRLRDDLRILADESASAHAWPQASLQLCGRAGVYRWFLPKNAGGLGWSDEDLIRGYIRLAEADLTTAFVITQFMGALRRISASGNASMIDRWISDLASGEKFATVGISHLTTSSRHLATPILAAQATADGYRLDGVSPWVTGAPYADVFVIGATLSDGREILAAVPSDMQGVSTGDGVNLIALSGSCTDQVRFDNVCIQRDDVLVGPVTNVLSSQSGGAGGLQTSALAVGLSRAASKLLADEASRRPDLREASDELTREVDQSEASLLRAGRGEVSLSDCDPAKIRGDANRLALRSTQAALTAAKGAGFVDGHLAGRLCKQAMFFLVWSCPAPVANAHICEFAKGTVT